MELSPVPDDDTHQKPTEYNLDAPEDATLSLSGSSGPPGKSEEDQVTEEDQKADEPTETQDVSGYERNLEAEETHGTEETPETENTQKEEAQEAEFRQNSDDEFKGNEDVEREQEWPAVQTPEDPSEGGEREANSRNDSASPVLEKELTQEDLHSSADEDSDARSSCESDSDSNPEYEDDEQNGSSSRIEELAKPREELHKDYIPNRQYQPPSPERKASKSSGKASERIEKLAQPRKQHPNFKADKPSVYWPDRDPERPPPEPSQRVVELAKPRERSDRDTRDPVWEVPRPALSASASERITALSRPREYKNFAMPKPADEPVPESALKASPSDRINQLSKPRRVREKEDEEEGTGVNPAALKATPSQRIEQLSQPKPLPDAYKQVRSPIWEPPESALKASPSLRTEQLSKAKKTNALAEYDPYTVSEAAKSASPSDRITLLALPKRVNKKRIMVAR